MLVGKHCRRDVVTIRKSQSVVEAARRMREFHVGDLVVVEGERDIPVGVLTDRDLVVGVLAGEADRIAKLEVGDVLTEEAVVARHDEEISDVLRRMQRKSVRRVPVVDGAGSLIGIFTLDDGLALVAGDLATSAGLVKHQREHERERRP